MLLQDYFADQLHQIRVFFDDPDQGARVLAVDEQLMSIAERTLIKLDGLEENEHVLQPTTIAFDDSSTYARQVLTEFVEANEPYRQNFADAGIELPIPRNGEPVEVLADYVQRLSDCWPPSEGNYILVLHPASVADPQAFLTMAARLASMTTPPIVKWLFFVDGAVVPNDFPPDHPLLALQRWEADSDEVKQDLADQLQDKNLPPKERLKLTSMAAGFAAGEGDISTSELLHLQTIQLSRQQNDVPSEATAHYHMGNALLAQEEFERAERHLSEATVLAVDCEMHSLVGMAMTHLGLCLDALQREPDSNAAFEAASATFAGLSDLPAQARVHDVRATLAMTKEDKESAQMHWEAALALFQSIEPGPLDPVRDGGIKEMQEKLKEHCGVDSTGEAS